MMINEWLNSSSPSLESIANIKAIYNFKISLVENGPIVAYFTVDLKNSPMHAI